MPDTCVQVGGKRGAGHPWYYIVSYSGKAWGFAEILLPRGRMSCLTIRGIKGIEKLKRISTKGFIGKNIRLIKLKPVFGRVHGKLKRHSRRDLKNIKNLS